MAYTTSEKKFQLQQIFDFYYLEREREVCQITIDMKKKVLIVRHFRIKGKFV